MTQTVHVSISVLSTPNDDFDEDSKAEVYSKHIIIERALAALQIHLEENLRLETRNSLVIGYKLEPSDA